MSFTLGDNLSDDPRLAWSDETWTNPVEGPPPGMKTLASFVEWWAGASERIRRSREKWIASRNKKIGQKRGEYASWQDSWKPVKWEGSPWAGRYGEQQTGMDELASRIRGGVTASDTEAAQNYTAGLYGMTPSAYSALVQGWAARIQDPNAAAQTDAEAAAKYMETIAGSQFAQEQAKADRVMLAQMEEQMGKQLESIFGERGGLGGFQAAYELTTQLQNDFLTAKTQEHLSMFNQAVSAVNANNGYYSELISNGTMVAGDYLKMRFDLLQTSFENYVTAMDQTKKDFETQYTLSENERQRIDSNFASQIEQMEKQLLLEMGGQTTEEYINSLYNMWSQAFKDQDAINNAKGNEPNKANQAGSAVMTTVGGVLVTVPGGQLPGLLLLLMGGILGIFG